MRGERKRGKTAVAWEVSTCGYWVAHCDVFYFWATLALGRPIWGQKIGCSPRHRIAIRRPQTATPMFAFTPSGFLKINPQSRASPFTTKKTCVCSNAKVVNNILFITD
jgi:hypothetical protein